MLHIKLPEFSSIVRAMEHWQVWSRILTPWNERKNCTRKIATGRWTSNVISRARSDDERCYSKRHAADNILHLLGKRFGWTLLNQACYMYTSQIFKQTKHGSRRSQNLAIFGIFISPPDNMKRGRKHTGAEFFFAHVSRESSLLWNQLGEYHLLWKSLRIQKELHE